METKAGTFNWQSTCNQIPLHALSALPLTTCMKNVACTIIGGGGAYKLYSMVLPVKFYRMYLMHHNLSGAIRHLCTRCTNIYQVQSGIYVLQIINIETNALSTISGCRLRRLHCRSRQMEEVKPDEEVSQLQLWCMMGNLVLHQELNFQFSLSPTTPNGETSQLQLQCTKGYLVSPRGALEVTTCNFSVFTRSTILIHFHSDPL